MSPRRLRWLGLLLPCLLAACQRLTTPLPDDAYVWQRVWTPAVTQAISESAGDIRVWRVLAAQTDGNGRLQVFHPDRTALGASGRPVMLVVRIDGQLAHWDEVSLLADTQALWRDWQHEDMAIAGLEIDHDCGTARLPAYASYLAHLRPLLGSATLSITALPAWLHAPALDAVLAEVDESVLQVHAVRDPRAGLFDPEQAWQWAQDYSGRSSKPFRLAVPDYGTQVSWDEQGHLAGVQSEAPVLDSAESSRELLAMPTQMRDFLVQLQRNLPPHLVGIAWFRLPTEQDSRAWSLATWLTLIRRQPLLDTLTLLTRPSATQGMLDIVLQNSGPLDAPLPARIVLPAACTLADGINGYTKQQDRNTLSIERRQPGLLRAHHQRVIGWARCGAAGVELHVQR